ncbi:LysR family transcriptional regulator [Thalassotalea sediminis]|uniref:LysR family transcriptional regulator n=1 Tax=Thalassotalea sediminis TaxID=1759089 RepID=UPI0025727B7E|nr:LysR family transcriptional regulator [Thalassotalea sediminis]
MDLKQLKYFTAVYENGSFNAAAKACFIAQPSISTAIAQLEAELQHPLFIRQSTGVSVTDEGKQLYAMAKQLLGQAQAIKSSFTQQDTKTEFALGVTKGLGVARMSQLLKTFISRETNMSLTLVPQDAQCHARIITKDELTSTESYETIWQEEFVLALPLNHPLALKRNVTLADLQEIDLIQRTPCSAWQTLSRELSLAKVSPRIRAKIQTIDYAIGLVKAGLGGAIVPAHKEVIEIADLCFKNIQGLNLKREIVLAYQTPSPLLNSLKSIVSHAHTEHLPEFFSYNF